MHSKRWITAILLIGIFIPAIGYGPRGLFLFLTCLVVGISLYEYLGLAFPTAERVLKWSSYLLGLTFPLTAFFGEKAMLSILPGILIVTMVVILFRSKEEVRVALPRLSKVIFGVLYTGLLPSYLILIRDSHRGVIWIFFLLTVVFTGDTAAFYIGRELGRHKLYPTVSPGKSIEGSIGGGAGSLIGGIVFKGLFLKELTWPHCLGLAIGLGALGQLGDLCESMLKRSAGQKDSGRLLPGHGGFLDRIDSLLFGAPFLYYYISYLAP